MKTVPRLTLDDARVIMQAAERRSREIGVDMGIAIADDGGHLLMFHRMDDARITSIDIAISKAFTAAAARRSTPTPRRPRSTASCMKSRRWPGGSDRMSTRRCRTWRCG